MRNRRHFESAVLLALALIGLSSCCVAHDSHKAYFVADPNLNADLRPWDHIQIGGSAYQVEDHATGMASSGAISVVSDPLSIQGKVYKLSVTPGANFATHSATSDRVDIWNNARDYMGKEGQETWEHFKIMFPAGAYKAAPGSWNWLAQHHNDDGDITFLKSGAVKEENPELAWGIDTRGRLNNVETTELFMIVRGGDDRNPPPETKVYAGAPLLYDHWYDMLVHVIWSHRSDNGLVEWWLDGKRLASEKRATLWQRPDGRTDHVNFEFSHYRLHVPWNSSVYYSKVKLGNSKEAVAF